MDPDRPVRRAVAAVLGVVVSLGLGVGAILNEKLRGTAAGVIVAIVVSGVLFVGANKWFDQAQTNWRRFGAVTGGLLGFGITAILVGNRILAWKTSTAEDATDLTAWLLVVGLLGGAAFGYVLTGLQNPRARIAAGVAFGVLYGAMAGAFVRRDSFPAMKIVPLLLWPVVGAIVLGGLAALQRKRFAERAVLGATLGWLIGAWMVPTLGAGTRAEAVSGALLIAGAPVPA